MSEQRVVIDLGGGIRLAAPKLKVDDYDENVYAAMQSLERLRKGIIPQEMIIQRGIRTRTEWLMELNYYVAKAYGIDRDELLDSWMNHYGHSLVAGAFRQGLKGGIGDFMFKGLEVVKIDWEPKELAE